MEHPVTEKGFTLIELMIVVAIVGILASIAIPQFSNLIVKSQEGVTKGNLGSLRSAVAIYYSGNDGVYPVDNLQVLVPTYIQAIPIVFVPSHT